MGDINAGAKVVAGGNVFVMGKIEGFVHAGAEGNEKLAFELGGKNYNAPVQLVGDFINNKTSLNLGSVEPSYRPG
ncbi:septum site-determining protein MinC, partial [Clostridioides difficile]|uniref:septum site-determining protein MinC n=1 Tax=Clostridioides difficile TaxID=1496 RepID=UPI0023507C90